MCCFGYLLSGLGSALWLMLDLNGGRFPFIGGLVC